LRTKSLSLNKEHSSELVFLIIKLSSDDINHINFDLFGRLLKFVFIFVILLLPLLIKFRVSAHNLEIKKGRYIGVKTEDRICKLCNTGVEDETHFLLQCPVKTVMTLTWYRHF
jgi:hypothetical protein